MNQDDAPAPGVSRSAARFALGCFFLLNMLNYADRLLFGVTQELIRKDLGFSDFELGLLGGPAFAFLYMIAAFPIARLAERHNRIGIIAICFSMWSLLTGLCGLAGSFVQMLLLRSGVSIGEAGCAPSAHSLISDFFPQERRTSAMATFAAAGPAGALLASMCSAALAQHLGWRAVFAIAGASGLFLALAILFTIREPQRQAGLAHLPVRHVLPVLFGRRSYWLGGLAGAVAGLASYSNYQFIVSFLMRVHGLSIGQAGIVLGLVIGGTGIVMTLSAGWIIDRSTPRFPAIRIWLPAAGLAWSGAFFASAFAASATSVAIVLLVVGSMGQHFYMPALFTLAQNVAPPAMRATSAALMTTMIAFLGFAVGPPLTGLFSDIFGRTAMTVAGIDPLQCAKSLSPACAAAGAEGLRMSLLAGSSFWIVAATLYWLSGRSAAQDSDAAIVNPMVPHDA